MRRITEFNGDYRFLSNFYPAKVWLDDVIYPTVEHAYQAAKILNGPERAKIRQAPTPGEAKRRGRIVALRSDWDDIKDHVMRDLLNQKFAAGTYTLTQLLETGNAELVEGNYWHDNYWGACECERCHGKVVPQNKLGRMLMDIRKLGL